LIKIEEIKFSLAHLLLILIDFTRRLTLFIFSQGVPREGQGRLQTKVGQSGTGWLEFLIMLKNFET
jgi:hypothetical protein